MKPLLFAVTGNPILHSQSPGIFNAAFRKTGLNAHYIRLHAENAKEAIQTARETGMKGLNVTAPFKQTIIPHLKSLDPSAQKTGSVNTVRLTPKQKGFNTDIQGIQKTITPKFPSLKGKKVLLLGAGGAAHTAAFILTRMGATLTLTNRSIPKGKKLAQKFNVPFMAPQSPTLHAVTRKSDLIVSALATADSVIPLESLSPKTAVLDAFYRKESRLVKASKKKGCQILSGKKWLTEQAAESFRILTGKKAPRLHSPKKNNPTKSNIALIGFMGSGKTATGRMLALATGKKFTDLDTQIEDAAQKTIPEIFSGLGEKEFRKLETTQLQKACRQKNQVIACGGGITLRAANRKLLQKNAITLWLWANPATIRRRIQHQQHRPLLPQKTIPAIQKLLTNRIPSYAACADLLIPTNRKKPAQITREILHEIH